MRNVRWSTWGLLVLAGILWVPASAEAQGDKCRKIVEKLTKQVEDPSNEEVNKFKAECPQEAKSIGKLDYYRNQVKAHRQLIADAVDVVKTAVDELTKNPAGTGQEGMQ
jgi:hypothetical protein